MKKTLSSGSNSGSLKEISSFINKEPRQSFRTPPRQKEKSNSDTSDSEMKEDTSSSNDFLNLIPLERVDSSYELQSIEINQYTCTKDLELALRYNFLIQEALKEKIDSIKNKSSNKCPNFLKSLQSILTSQSISEEEANKLIQGPLQAIYLLIPKEIYDYFRQNSNQEPELNWVEYKNSRRLLYKDDADAFTNLFYKQKENSEKANIILKKTLTKFILPVGIISTFITALRATSEYEKLPINENDPNTTYPNWFANLAIITTLSLNNYLISAAALSLYFIFYNSSKSSEVIKSSAQSITSNSKLRQTESVSFKPISVFLGKITHKTCDELEAYYDAYNKDTVVGKEKPIQQNKLTTFLGHIKNFLFPSNPVISQQNFALTSSATLFEEKCSGIEEHEKLKSRLLNCPMEHNIQHNGEIKLELDYDDSLKDMFLEQLQKSSMIGVDKQIERLACIAAYIGTKFLTLLNKLQEEANSNPYRIIPESTLESKCIESELKCDFSVILQGPPGTGKSVIQTKFSTILSTYLNTQAEKKEIKFYRNTKNELVATVGEKSNNLIKRQIEMNKEARIFYLYKDISELLFKNVGLASLFILLIATHILRENNADPNYNIYDSQGDYIPEGRLYSNEHSPTDKIAANIVDPGIKWILLFAIISAAIHKFVEPPRVPYEEVPAFGLSLIGKEKDSAFNLATHSHIDLDKANRFSKSQTFRDLLLFGPSNDTNLKNLKQSKEIIVFNSNKKKSPQLKKDLTKTIHSIFDEIYNHFSTILPLLPINKEDIMNHRNTLIQNSLRLFEFENFYKIDRQVFFLVRKHIIHFLISKIDTSYWPEDFTNLRNEIEEIERNITPIPTRSESSGFYTPSDIQGDNPSAFRTISPQKSPSRSRLAKTPTRNISQNSFELDLPHLINESSQDSKATPINQISETGNPESPHAGCTVA